MKDCAGLSRGHLFYSLIRYLWNDTPNYIGKSPFLECCLPMNLCHVVHSASDTPPRMILWPQFLPLADCVRFLLSDLFACDEAVCRHAGLHERKLTHRESWARLSGRRRPVVCYGYEFSLRCSYADRSKTCALVNSTSDVANFFFL